MQTSAQPLDLQTSHALADVMALMLRQHLKARLVQAPGPDQTVAQGNQPKPTPSLSDTPQPSTNSEWPDWHDDVSAAALGGYGLGAAPLWQNLLVVFKNGKLMLQADGEGTPQEQRMRRRDQMLYPQREWHTDMTVLVNFDKGLLIADLQPGQRVRIHHRRVFRDFRCYFVANESASTRQAATSLSEDSNANTSELEGLVSKLSAMLRAVMSRSCTTTPISMCSCSFPSSSAFTLSSNASPVSKALSFSIAVSPSDKEPDATELAGLAELLVAAVDVQKHRLVVQVMRGVDAQASTAQMIAADNAALRAILAGAQAPKPPAAGPATLANSGFLVLVLGGQP